jgi:hypothetical protein
MLKAEWAWWDCAKDLDVRLSQLEKHVHYPHNETAMKEAAARVQGMNIAQGCIPDGRVPMRTDVETIRTLTAFAKRLLNTEDFGHAVTFEVRQAARRALGLPEVKEYDL